MTPLRESRTKVLYTGAFGKSNQIEKTIAIDRERNPGAIDDLARYGRGIGHAFRDRHDDLRFDRLFGQTVLNFRLDVDRRSLGNRHTSGEWHTDAAIASDDLFWDRHISRAGGDVVGRRCPEKPAARGLPNRNRDGVANTDLGWRGLAVRSKALVKALFGLRQ